MNKMSYRLRIGMSQLSGGVVVVVVVKDSQVRYLIHLIATCYRSQLVDTAIDRSIYLSI